MPFLLCYKAENALLRGAFFAGNFQKSEIFKKRAEQPQRQEERRLQKFIGYGGERLGYAAENTKIPV